MADLFRVDFYPHNWLTGTMDMTPEERGVYIQIVALIYAQRGPIKNDPAWIGRASNCSSRMARSIVDKLVHNHKLTITPEGFITNSRSEYVLKEVRTRHELGVNLRRTQLEKQGELNKNKGLSPAVPQRQEPEPIPVSIHKETPTPLTIGKLKEEMGVGVLKDLEGGRGVFSIEHLLDDDSIMEARLIAKGLDVYHLMRVYDEGVNSGIRERPKYPKKAFLGWLPKYVKGFKK